MGFGGGSKPKAPELKIPTSPFSTLQDVSFDSPFATASSEIVPLYKGARTNVINTESQLNQPLQQAAESAQQGFGAGLSYLAADPSQRFADISGGRDLYYNVMADQLASAEKKALGRAALQGQSRGLSNSTTQGAAIAGIMDDSLKREREAQLAAFNLGQQTATNQVGTTLGAISGLNNLTTPLGNLVSGQLIQGRQFGDNYARAKAQAEYQAKLVQYQQDMQDYQQNRGFGGSIGSLIGAGLAIGAAPFTGGASLSLLPAATSLGGGIGSFATGGTPSQVGNILSPGLGSLGSLGSTFGGTSVNAAPATGVEITPFSPTANFLQQNNAMGGGFY